MSLGSTQPLTETSTRNVRGSEGSWHIRLTASPPSLRQRPPQSLTGMALPYSADMRHHGNHDTASHNQKHSLDWWMLVSGNVHMYGGQLQPMAAVEGPGASPASVSVQCA
jgi:hypothetical protein